MSAVFAELELELATHPRFGDPEPIRTRVAAFAELALQGLATRDRSARQLLDALTSEPASPAPSGANMHQRTLLYPMVRDAIAVLSDGGHDAGTRSSSTRVLEIAADTLRRGSASFMPSAWPALTSARHEAILCGAPPGEEPFSQHFHGMFERKLAHDLAAAKLVVRTPSAAEIGYLDEAKALLDRHTPHLFDSALAHVELIAVIDSAAPQTTPLVESASWVQFPGTVFLSPLALSSSRQAAESLLHEAIHHKNYDLRRCRSILARDYSEARAQPVVAHWNEPTPKRDNIWPADRALSACHVYVALALLHACWASDVVAHVYNERARYLATQLLDGAGTDFGEDGSELVRWLAALASRLASST